MRAARTWAPLLAGFLCLVATTFAGVVVDWILMMLAFGLILDGVTAWWERAGGTGNLTTYRQ